MQYGLPFRTVFHSTDPRIKNKIVTGTLYVLGSLILAPVLVGILGFFILVGYGLRVLQNVQFQQEPLLPEWDQWRSDLRSGFFLVVALFIWLLPFGILSFALTWGGELSAAGVGVLLSGVGALLVNVVSWILTPGITIAFAQRRELADAFHFRVILAWVAQNWLPCLGVSLISALVSFLLLLVAALAGTLALVIGLLVTIPCALWGASMYQYHLLGQLARTYDGHIMVLDTAQFNLEA